MADRISCDICMDLIPLVRDGIASEDSRAAVEEHIKDCAGCRAAFEESSPAPEPEKAEVLLGKIRSRARIGMSMLLMFGMLFGISLTEGTDMFANSIIMPLLGVLGYILFRWRSLYLMPVLLFATSAAGFLLGMLKGIGAGDSASLLIWAGLYSLFAAAGSVAAGLMHFALRKEKNDDD